jgi:hypothetical protein
MWFDEFHVPVWKAGEVAPAGTYVRIDNRSYQRITLEQEGPLPASFDGHRARYACSHTAPRSSRDHGQAGVKAARGSLRTSASVALEEASLHHPS